MTQFEPYWDDEYRNKEFKIFNFNTKNVISGKIYQWFKRKYHDRLYNNFRLNYSINDSFHFNGDGIEFYGKGELIIGENSYMGRYSSIQLDENSKVIIGKNVAIGHFVKIITSGRNTKTVIKGNKITYDIGNVIIGDNTWIGHNVFIRQGITIGNNCVIGANSIVTKDVKDKTIVGGCPARKLK